MLQNNEHHFTQFSYVQHLVSAPDSLLGTLLTHAIPLPPPDSSPLLSGPLCIHF